MIRKLLPILGITFVDILGFSILIPSLPFLATDLHASPFTIGVLFSTFSLCQLIAGPVWGNISDRIGRKGVLIVSQIGATIGWAMLAYAPTIWFIFLARIVEGVSGGNIGVTQAYVADLVTPKERARAFSYISATFAAGMAFGPLIGAAFLRYGHSAPFLAAAALQLLTLIITVIMLPESRAKTDEPNVGYKEILRTFQNGELSPLLWQKLALALSLYAWFSVITLYMIYQLHFSQGQTYYFYSIFAVLNVIANVGGVGRASDKFGDRTMALIGIGSLVAAFALVPFAHEFLFMIPIMALFSVGMAFANTGLTALISGTVDERRQGTVLGVTSSLDSLSGIVSPPISTGLLGRFGSPWASAASLFFAVIAFALGLRVHTNEKRRGRAAAQTVPETGS
ncbi:MAG TPA: MFS transporter [Candidatus Baltobacteraceae bacterium]|nr:MFS transporter [Candidatus Baltobacteraceae bacterium]